VKFVATKECLTKKKFSPLSFLPVFGSGIRDPGSGMGKNQDPGSGINIPDPQHWLVESVPKCHGSATLFLPHGVSGFRL